MRASRGGEVILGHARICCHLKVAGSKPPAATSYSFFAFASLALLATRNYSDGCMSSLPSLSFLCPHGDQPRGGPPRCARANKTFEKGIDKIVSPSVYLQVINILIKLVIPRVSEKGYFINAIKAKEGFWRSQFQTSHKSKSQNVCFKLFSLDQTQFTSCFDHFAPESVSSLIHPPALRARVHNANRCQSHK